jgi:O-antigen/teichoic acid export membrane protein
MIYCITVMQNLILIFKLLKTRNFHSLAQDSFWTMFSQIFLVLINIASVYILANLLSPNDFGQFKLVTTWLGIALGVGYTGYIYTLAQKISKNDYYDLKSIYFETFLKSLITFVGLFAIATYYFYNNNYNLGFGFLFASFLAPVLCVSTLVNIYYMGKKNFKMFALAQNFVDFFQLLTVAVLAYLSSNFIIIISGYLFATIIFNLIIIIKSYKDENGNGLLNNPAPSNDGETKMRSKLNISGIIYAFTSQLDKLLIFHLIGAAPLAIYSIVTAIADQARTPAKAIASAIFPRMTSPIFTKKKLYTSFALLSALCIFIYLALVLSYPTIFYYIFPKYIEYIYLANIASLGILFAPTQLLYLYCQSKGDLESLNKYANLNTILQVLLFLPAAFLGLIYFFYAKIIINLVSTIYIFYRLRMIQK